jgi:hypothetical protein
VSEENGRENLKMRSITIVVEKKGLEALKIILPDNPHLNYSIKGGKLTIKFHTFAHTFAEHIGIANNIGLLLANADIVYEQRVEDHNSLWGGAGPDCIPMRREGANKYASGGGIVVSPVGFDKGWD